MRIFIVTMLRNGELESHHYCIGAFTDLAKAFIEGEGHAVFHRDRKYVPQIMECVVDADELNEVPYRVAKDYAKLKHPEMFDDKENLIEEPPQKEGV